MGLRRHVLVPHSFKRPNYCSVCKKLLYGLRLQQGYKCSTCRVFRCHKDCAKHGTTACGNEDINAYDLLGDATKRLAHMVVHGAAVSQPDVDGGDALSGAIQRKDEVMVTYVLDRYIATESKDINTQDRMGNTPLHHMITCQLPVEVMKHALRSPVLIHNIPNSDGNTPLHLLCHKAQSYTYMQIAEKLISGPEDVNRQNINGETPVHKAMYNDHIREALIRMLIRHNADLNISSNSGETALHYAARLNLIRLAKSLMLGGARESLHGGRVPPSQEALELGNKDMYCMITRVNEICAFLTRLKLSCYEQMFVNEELKIISNSAPRIGACVVHNLDAKTFERLGVKDISHQVLLSLHSDNFKSSVQIEESV